MVLISFISTKSTFDHFKFILKVPSTIWKVVTIRTSVDQRKISDLIKLLPLYLLYDSPSKTKKAYITEHSFIDKNIKLYTLTSNSNVDIFTLKTFEFKDDVYKKISRVNTYLNIKWLMSGFYFEINLVYIYK